jgi:hypothetical protein
MTTERGLYLALDCIRVPLLYMYSYEFSAEKAQLSAGVISKPHLVVRHVTLIRSGRAFFPENLGALELRVLG